MSNDTVMTVTVKGIGDFSDVVSNVSAVQKALTKLKLPDKLGDNLNKNISNFMKEYEKYQNKISEGIKTQGDYNQVEKSLNKMRSLYQEIGQDAQKLTKLDMKDMLDLDVGEFKNISNALTDIIKQIGNTKIDTSTFTKAFDDIRKITKSTKVTGDNGILNQMIGHINTGQINEAKKQLQELQAYAKKVAPRTTAEGKQAPGTLSVEKYNQLTAAIAAMGAAFNKADAEMAPLIEEQNKLQKELEETKQKAAQGITKEFSKYNQASKDVEKVTDSLKRMHAEEFNFNREAQNIDRQIQSYFGLSQMIRKVGDIAKDAFQTVKELDKAMTETAVVTNFDVGDMWEMLPTYTQQANQLGSTIKDVYEAATLYYQQGLNTNQAMSLANETLKMARIAGLGAAEATDMMTAALRGFNMEINQTSAQKINDVYSELAAITASDTQEIGSAMERTASIANSANMEFETTSAFLAQMIETTREAPENLGTAMKTIVARFQEMKQDPTKLVDSEGVAMDANKVDKALKTIGISLMNTKGEFRDLDDVFLDISAKWDSLTQGQQRYIATIAAGSRQQSRFIAMMSNYERTMELVDAANNSAGASQRQFEKTLDSMEAKLNKLKNAWDQFTMGLMNNQILKFGVDALTEGFTIVNKFIDILGKIPPKPFEGVTKSILTLVTTLGMLNFGKKVSRGLVMGGAAWWKGEGGFAENFTNGFKNGTVDAQTKGRQAGVTWTQAASKAIHSSSNTIKGAMRDAFNMQEAGSAQTIESALRQTLQQASIASNGFNGWEAGDQYIEAVIDGVRSGQSTLRQAIEEVFKTAEIEVDTDEIIGQLELAARAPLDPDKLSVGFEDLTRTASSAGDSIRDFGYALQGTPLEGFGNTLIRIGNLMDSTSRLAKKFGKSISAAFKAAQGAEKGKSISTFFNTLFPVLDKIPGKVKIITAVIAAIVGTILIIKKHQQKVFEGIEDAAAAASEAYDSAKQETSELADAIEQIKANDDAFNGLVIGTAAFNEQLVKTNQQIMELLKKYPMLNDPKYLSIDKNGLMHISDEGLEEVKDYQRQKQANASALNLLQTADLNTAETNQKLKQLRKVKSTDTLDTYNQRLEEAMLVEQQAKAQQEMAKINAVNTALVDKEIHNREKVSAIIADQYDTRKKEIKLAGESMANLKQEYADFYGYTYNQTTKKLTDIEGNEIDVDNKTIKDAVKEIRVVTNIETDAKSLDKIINTIDSKFNKSLGDSFKGSAHLFSDILTDNIDVSNDLLNNLLTNPDKLQSAVESLSEKEIAAILGVSEDVVTADTNKYKTELTNKIIEKAQNIAETQAQSYADLAGMMAQTMGTSHFDELGNVVADITTSNKQLIQNQLSKLTEEQKNLLASIGTTLRDNVGVESMKTFLDQAIDIYTSGSEDAVADLDNIIQGVNWDSPIARLKAYNNMIAKGVNPSVRKLGKDLLNSTDSANLLGEAFEEFYDSSDFQDLAENMDNFVDSSGKLNASSIKDMAKECHSLNNLLDSGAISAGGVAAALNALGTDGNLTVLDLNQNLLEFLSTANQLDDVLSEAHSLIENFDWGLDEGEAEDFAKNGAEKWKELYDNGEYGNSQLENYAKFILGEQKWIDALKDHSGNIEDALADLNKEISVYSDGFEQAWINMADSTEDKFSDVHYADNGDIIWETKGRTTQELVDWLADTRGITHEWAQLMVEDFANYSYDFKTELAANDFNAGLDKYLPERTNTDGELFITASELKTLADAQGTDRKGILQEIADYKNISVEELEKQLNILENIDEHGQALLEEDDIKQLNEDYSKEKLGEDSSTSWLTQYQKMNGEQGQEGTVDLKAAITGAIADGLEPTQANEMARLDALELFNSGMDVFYDGVKLQADDLADAATFADKIAEITDNARWNQVGQAIAEGVISYLKGGNKDKEPKSGDGLSKKDGGSGFTKKTAGTETTNTTTEIINKEEHTQVVADAITTSAFEVVNQTLDEIDANPDYNANLTTTGDSQGVDEVRAGVASAIAEAKDPLKILTVGDTTGITTVSSGLSTLPSSKDISITATDNTGGVIGRIGSKLASLARQALNIGPRAATGMNNTIKTSHIPTFASAAKGKGQVGPKNKGGLTLTGEEGYEIAWLPSSGQSMVLGVGGPQMVNLPSDAVVYTHEQSKDIIKRKGIPAGSHAGRHPTGGGGNGGGNGGGSGGGNGSNGNGNDNSDEEKKALDAVARVSVWWENIARRTEKTQRRMDKNQKTYEKYLKNLQATLKRTGTVGQGDKYIAQLNKYIKLNNQQLKKANKELRGLDKGYKDPYDQTARKNVYENLGHENIVEISFQGVDDEGNATTKKAFVDLSGYIKQLKDGSYVVDQKALNKISNRSQRKATADAANKELNDRISKKYKAEDAIEKAREQLEAFANELYETFFAWETSLTKIWNITQKIDEATRKISRIDAASDLLGAQISSGMKKSTGKTAQQDLKLFQQRLEQQNKLVENREAAIKQAKTDVYNAYSKGDEFNQRSMINDQLTADKRVKAKLENDQLKKEQKKLKKKKKPTKADKKRLKQIAAQIEKNNKTIGTDKQLKEAQALVGKKGLNQTQITGLKEARKKINEDMAVIDKARQFTKVTKNADGTVTVDFDYDKFEQEKMKGNITADMAKAIEDYVTGITEATKNLDELQESLITDVTEYYNNLTELKDQWADYESQLIKITEDSNKKELDNLKKLSDSIKQAIDDLLNDVKKKLDERRRLEDNRKTEQDISRKQQRLAALQADTSGGHQVEIAQLQSEIADAQQNYQRSLEDQLLDKLQQQADEAQKQRERQIQLQETLVTSVNNIAQVDAWMAKISDENTTEEEIAAIKNEMKQAYRDANGYDETGIYGQEKIDRDFETFFQGLRTNQEKQVELTAAIKALTETLDYLRKQENKLDINVENAKEKGLTVAQAKSEIPYATYKELKEKGGYTAKDFKKSNVKVQSALDAGFTPQQLKKGGYTAADFKAANMDYDTVKALGFKDSEMASAWGASYAMTKKNVSGASAQAGTGKSAKTLQKIVNANANDEAIQKDMAKVKASVDINGKAKGGKVTGRIGDAGKSIGYNKGSTFYWQDWDEKTGKPTGKVKSWTIDKLPAKYVGAQVEARDALRYAITHQNVGTVINKEIEQMINASTNAKAAFVGKEFKLKNGAKGIMSSKGNILYDQKGTVYIWNPSTGANKVYKKYNKKTYLAEANKKNSYSPVYARALKYHGIKAYATGGLATATGPAWLDGTPSKPELVLNATDTKNFIALKDVLASAMKGMGDTSNTYGDIMYEININVDKIEKDYDVDRVVDKVKKEITKGAGYRNVTQVRNLR